MKVQVGDQVEVDASIYGQGKVLVCVDRIVEGEGAPYPVRVTLPGGVPAQFRLGEVLRVVSSSASPDAGIDR